MKMIAQFFSLTIMLSFSMFNAFALKTTGCKLRQNPVFYKLEVSGLPDGWAVGSSNLSTMLIFSKDGKNQAEGTCVFEGESGKFGSIVIVPTNGQTSCPTSGNMVGTGSSGSSASLPSDWEVVSAKGKFSFSNANWNSTHNQCEVNGKSATLTLKAK